MEGIIKTKQDILKILHQNRVRLKEMGVSRIGLFGSFVRGEQHHNSDIDLLVKFAVGKKRLTHLWSCPFSWRRFCSVESRS